MSSLLQQVLHEIERLSPQEQWQVMEHLISQLRGRSDSATYDSAVTVNDHELEHLITTEANINTNQGNNFTLQLLAEKRTKAKQVLASTRGSWGTKTPDEIDAELESQRLEDWGE